MTFLADENFPFISSQLLEQHGHKIRSAALLFSGLPDIRLLREAIEKEEFIITFDKDFGELIFKNNLPHPPDIILFRLQNFTPDEPAVILLNVIKENIYSFADYFTVIGKNKIRQRKLPGKN
jgi:predicted nuclease of predicted toxin-antitoxin system